MSITQTYSGAAFFLILGLTFLSLYVLLLLMGIYALFKRQLRVTRHTAISGQGALILGGVYIGTGVSGLLCFALDSGDTVAVAWTTSLLIDGVCYLSLLGLGASIIMTLFFVLARTAPPQAL